MVETRVVLARHGSPENPAGVFYGHLPGFGLSEEGRRQALGLGDFLKGFPLCHAYSSPLERALETAQLAVSRLPRQVPITIREDLLEAEFGKYIQGVPRAQVPVRRPLFIVHLIRPGVLPFDESVSTMADRVGRVCAEAQATCAGQAALVVSHADPIKALWNRHLGRADWRLHGLHLPKGGFLELVYQDARLTTIKPYPPVLAPASPGPA
jgi:broad specificity phosphatase PhoE